VALPLDSPRWHELAQAYGPAGDIPQLLDHLPRVSDDERAGLWFGLWGTLCVGGRIYTAAYAAVPHLLAFAERRPLADRVQALHLAGAVEAARLGAHAPPLPDDLADAYVAAVARIPVLIARSVGETWDADTTQVLASVLAVAKGHPRFGTAALALDAVVRCPVCGAAHAPAGWEEADPGTG
jgi:hypothetical protein